MEIKDFVKKFAEQFDDTPASQITPDTSFKDIDEWSSLVALNILAMIEDEYGLTLKSEIFRKNETILDVYYLVENTYK